MKRIAAAFAALISLVSVLVGLGVAAAAPALQANTVTVTMQDFAFAPKDITIPVGSSVVWKNAGTKKHTATADDNSFDTGVVAPGASSAPVTFSKTGKFAYFCQFHGAAGGTAMSGTITVVDASQAIPPAATAAATAAPAAAVPVGHVAFTDNAKGARGAVATFTFTSLPLPAEEQQYEAWFADGKNPLVSAGVVQVKADGTGTLTYSDPKGANLIKLYNVAFITTQGADLTKPGAVVFSGWVPPQTDVHVRHLMAAFPSTPDNNGLIIGALDQESILTDHVKFLADAIAKGNVALAKLHLEHVHNILTGTNGAKDLNGDGKLTISPPGDGFGIFNYLTVASQHAQLAAKQPDATDFIKVRASHIQIAAANATKIMTQIQALTVQAAALPSTAAMKPLGDQISKLNDQVVKGTPDASGAVTPTKGSAGLGVAYSEGLLMAGFDLVPGDLTAQQAPPPGNQPTQPPPPPPSTLAPATPAATQSAAVGGGVGTTVTITMKDFEFDPKTITIKAGTKVIFVNQGTKKHTATADDNSFDTGIITVGSSAAAIPFNKRGTFPFYCQFHGGPGGVDMAGVITVQ
ncbi:MAG: cupredoxin domain-containing protein [Aggregatilineales bacterium]